MKKETKEEKTLKSQANAELKKAPKEKRHDKDTLMNTPKEMNDGVKLMPFDDETLETFSLKKMNFKDMTGAQKNTLIVIVFCTILIILSALLPTIARNFGGLTFGNLHLFQPKEEESEKEDDSFASSKDYVVLGNNTTIRVDNIKFNNFTKGNDYKLIYNYVATDKVEDVNALKIYIEVYNSSKSLISRHAFLPKSESLEAKQGGTETITLSSNNFNKAHYIRVLTITDAELEDLPDETIIEDPENPDVSENPGGNAQPGGNGNTTDPSVDKNKLMTCTISKVDGSLRINKTFEVKFDKGVVSEYNVTYKITSLIDSVPKNYSKYYKDMLKQYKLVRGTVGTKASIEDLGFNATLTYSVVYSEYKNIEIDPEDYDSYPKDLLDKLLAMKTPYDLEIKRESSRAAAKKQLTAKDWICD